MSNLSLGIEINDKIILMWQSMLFSNKHYESFSLNNDISQIKEFKEDDLQHIEDKDR